jgi:hypothetical protein
MVYWMGRDAVRSSGTGLSLLRRLGAGVLVFPHGRDVREAA